MLAHLSSPNMLQLPHEILAKAPNHIAPEKSRLVGGKKMKFIENFSKLLKSGIKTSTNVALVGTGLLFLSIFEPITEPKTLVQFLFVAVGSLMLFFSFGFRFLAVHILLFIGNADKKDLSQLGLMLFYIFFLTIGFPAVISGQNPVAWARTFFGISALIGLEMWFPDWPERLRRRWQNP